MSLWLVASAQAQTISLVKDWNLMGINANLTLQELQTQLGADNILAIRGVGRTYKNTNLSFLNSFKAFEPEKGYWMKLRNPARLSYEPITYQDNTISLKEGWNLINPMSNLTLQEIKLQLGFSLEAIRGSAKVYKSSNPANINSFTQFEEPYGYWVRVNSDSILQFNNIQSRVYGESLNKNVEVYSDDEANLAIYYPSDISRENKTPIILFMPGWSFTQQESHLDYKSLLTFIASQGYSVFYVRSINELGSGDFIGKFEELLSMGEVPLHIDTTRIGVMGHSYGGGLSYSVFKHFVNTKGWGENGRFIFTMAPWFAFDMTKDDFKNLPTDTKIVNIEFIKSIFNDPRISFTLYDNLTSIDNRDKDYQVYDREDAGHYYPTGERDYSLMQGVLKPLDALIDYAFYNKQEAYTDALGVGTDNPYNGPQIIREKSFYQQDGYHPCDGADEYTRGILNNLGIDYCSIVN
jgi:hypothetical protein